MTTTTDDLPPWRDDIMTPEEVRAALERDERHHAEVRERWPELGRLMPPPLTDVQFRHIYHAKSWKQVLRNILFLVLIFLAGALVILVNQLQRRFPA
jgi:hypothetical protein